MAARKSRPPGADQGASGKRTKPAKAARAAKRGKARRSKAQVRVDREVDRALMARLRSDARRIAYRFGLHYRALDPEHPNVKSRYGICYEDGSIRIRLRHAKTRQPLRYSSLVDTLCHELAHLRHFHHGPSFQEFYARVLQYARNEGIYRPNSARQRASMSFEQYEAGLAGCTESGSPPPLPERIWHRKPEPERPAAAPAPASAVGPKATAPDVPQADDADPQLSLFG